MPEKTKTGKWIFPIRDADVMKKDGWFERKTKTKGISVRLARLKIDDDVVVQAYIFDTKEGWNFKKAMKWMKDRGIHWLAGLTEEEDTFKGTCQQIETITAVMSTDDAPELNSGHSPKEKDDDDDKKMPRVTTPKKKKKMVQTPKKQGT